VDDQPVARVGAAESTDFNNQMRAYARANNKILFDVAAIEAHDPAGKPRFDNRDGALALDIDDAERVRALAGH